MSKYKRNYLYKIVKFFDYKLENEENPIKVNFKTKNLDSCKISIKNSIVNFIFYNKKSIKLI